MTEVNGVAALMEATIALQLESIGTQATISKLNDVLSDANQKLTAAWTSCNESDPSDPGYSAFYYLQCAIQNLSGLAGSGQPTNPTTGIAYPVPADGPPEGYIPNQLPADASKHENLIDYWIDTFLGNPGNTSSNPLDFSQGFMLTVSDAFMNSSPSSKDPRLAIINSETSLLSSQSAGDEKTTENGINTTNNLAQHSQSASPLNNIASALTDFLNSGSSGISQITA